ncbi:ATP-binding protein, partial [Streptomyces anthocyanicus]|uniref:ATP-binding protein n=1 Tax=Streptomyces anthocyanicus TaxID=68174 RepID=UPI0036488767
MLVLQVADTGSGVDPAHAEQVFQRGWSTKPAGPAGRGLGLALVRQTVLRHAGTLTVREAPGGGAEFEAHLPLPTAPTEPGTGAVATPPAEVDPGTVPAAPPHAGTGPVPDPPADTERDSVPGQDRAPVTDPESALHPVAESGPPAAEPGSVPQQSIHPGRPTRSALHGGDV